MNRREPEIRSWIDGLVDLVGRVLAAINRRNAQFVARATRLMAPYAVRNLVTGKWRGVMLAASIALALVSFLLFSAYFNATATRLVGSVKPLELGEGIDAVAVASYETLRTFPDNVDTDPAILARGTPELALCDDVYSGLGEERFWGFKPGGVADNALLLAEGNFPIALGDVAVPESWAGRPGVEVGVALQLGYLDTEAGEWTEVQGRVVGLVRENGYVAGFPVTTFETMERLRGTAGGNAVLMRWSADTAPVQGERALDSLLDPVQILTSTTPGDRARALVGGVFSPVRVIVAIIFAFSALGVLNVMLLSFLQRKRQFGVFKATGAEDRELQVLLLLEGSILAIGGIVAGFAVAALGVWLLNRYTLDYYVINPVTVVVGLLLSAGVFYLGAWLPVGMLRRATVDELLRNRGLV